MQFRSAGGGSWAGRPRRLPAILAILLVLVLVVASAGYAQRFRGGPGYQWATPESFDGAFTFCRVVFRQVRGGDGGNWGVDWPRADLNLPTRLSELTKTTINVDRRTGEPNSVLIQLTQPELFRCPFIMMTEVGNLYFDEAEAKNLREYLLKGGFLWADDFWGEYAWEVWDGMIRKVLPSGPYPIKDLPMDHSIFHTVFTVSRVPQIPNIGFWRGTGGGTSERYGDSQVPHARAITDDHGRIMVLITHNTDIGDSFEHEGTDHEYFIAFSVDGYALGINALVYSMTH